MGNIKVISGDGSIDGADLKRRQKGYVIRCRGLRGGVEAKVRAVKAKRDYEESLSFTARTDSPQIKVLDSKVKREESYYEKHKRLFDDDSRKSEAMSRLNKARFEYQRAVEANQNPNNPKVMYLRNKQRDLEDKSRRNPVYGDDQEINEAIQFAGRGRQFTGLGDYWDLIFGKQQEH